MNADDVGWQAEHCRELLRLAQSVRETNPVLSEKLTAEAEAGRLALRNPRLAGRVLTRFARAHPAMFSRVQGGIA